MSLAGPPMRASGLREPRRGPYLAFGSWCRCPLMRDRPPNYKTCLGINPACYYATFVWSWY